MAPGSAGKAGTGIPVLKLGRHTPRFPVVQGGMGVRISAGGLSGAVARAGGVGTIASVALGLGSPHFTGKNYYKANKLALADELAMARKTAPDGVIAVNCMVALTDYEDMVRTSCENTANVIISGAGLPMKLPEFTADFPDVALVPIVSSTKAAKLIIKKWEKAYGRIPDALVVETPNTAGGHLGASPKEVDSPSMSLEAIVPDLVRFLEQEAGLDVPVISAGGIWGREDMLHAFELGARGVQMGTRFVCTRECDASDAFKQAYINAKKGDIIITESPVGLPGRAIKNPFLEAVKSGPPGNHKCIVNCLKNCTFKIDKKGYCIATALHNAQSGDVDHGLIFAGSNADRCTEIVGVEDVFRDLFG